MTRTISPSDGDVEDRVDSLEEEFEALRERYRSLVSGWWTFASIVAFAVGLYGAVRSGANDDATAGTLAFVAFAFALWFTARASNVP